MTPNYQDTDWGTSEDDAVVAESPVPLAVVEAILREFGYTLSRNDLYSPFLDFVKVENGKTSHATLSKPAFKSEKHRELVYEKNSIVDILLHLDGNPMMDGHKIRAVLEAKQALA